MAISAVVFDAYGTLFDVMGPARILAEQPQFSDLKPIWPDLGQNWRVRQLEYTWLRSLMRDHADFWQVTCDALDWALAAAGRSDPELRAALLALYRHLPAYPEAATTLQSLRASGVKCAILSNGTPDLLQTAVTTAGLDGLFDAVLSVESVGVYKPDPRVYALATERFDCPADQIVFVSSNGWDVAGAAAFGFRCLWVNRGAHPPERLPHGPEHILDDLRAVPQIVSGI
ncbi:MAG: haloacid dehalogenase type II [Paracoccaceae bacterium]|nr:haloacid dehalogenase type II [Paracoccaceae bacterium]